MNRHDEPQDPEKRKRMPAEVRLNLMRAVAEHFREHGNRNYDLLRENPEFSPYIGKHLGETGDKRLDRIVARVKANSPQRKGGGSRAAGEARLTAADVEADTSSRSAPPDSVDLLAGVRPVAVGHDQLQQLLEVRLPELERALDACCGEDGIPIDPPLYIKLLREQRATIDTIGRLAGRYQGQLNTARFTTGMLDILKRECGEDGERFPGVAAEIQDLIIQCGGLAPCREAKQ